MTSVFLCFHRHILTQTKWWFLFFVIMTEITANVVTQNVSIM